MAEQRTNIGMDDVLSSIRRLVSEQPPAPRRDVLVLTPALRIVDSPVRDPQTAAAWSQDLPPRPATPAAPVRLADFAVSPATKPRSAAPDLPRFEDDTAGISAAAPRPAAPVEPVMPPEDEIAAFFSSRMRPDLSLEARIAQIQSQLTETSADFELDDAPLARSVDPATLRRSDEAPAARLRPSRPALVQDAEELPPSAADQAQRARPAEAPQPDFEEALIDEDSLRDIVADLIRQELRGELGERITRNVRSLIRRELNRALALRDLSDER